MSLNRLGLGNAILEDTEVLHTSIQGKKAFGRIADLILAWAEKSYQLSIQEVVNIRLLSQSLLDFAYPENKSETGFLEFAVEQEKRFISVRFPGRLKGETESFEKEITHFWMNSERASGLKKNLGPHDRVEVRFHEKLNCIEWRVIHRVGIQEIELKEPSFAVFLDSSDSISSAHKKYTDLGDLPFEQLLEEVYRSGKVKQKSGELFLQGQSLQEEDEAARVVFEREQNEIEEQVKVLAKRIPKEEVERLFNGELSDEENEEIRIKADAYQEQLMVLIRSEQSDLKDQAKQAIREAKQRELQSQRRMLTLHQKVIKMEELLKRKELMQARSSNQVKILSDKLTAVQKKTAADASMAKAFREKALQMQAMLVKVKEENSALEKKMLEQKGREKSEEQAVENSVGVTRPGMVGQVQLEEATKKAERLQRALETEKAKVKQLSERVIAAEKESSSSGPLVQDLERKVEHSSKLAQNFKKEAETLKQKLVQSDAEKNKLRNEIRTLQAEMQTQLKRQAS